MILTKKEMEELREKLDDTLDSVKEDLKRISEHKRAGGNPPDSPLLETWIAQGRYITAMEHALTEQLAVLREKEKNRRGNTAMVASFCFLLILASFFFWLSGAEFGRSGGVAMYYGIVSVTSFFISLFAKTAVLGDN